TRFSRDWSSDVCSSDLGYASAKRLYTYELDIRKGFPPLIQRIISSGEKNGRINVRPVDKSRFAEEAATIMAIFNDAWSGNWGFRSEERRVGKECRCRWG